VRRLRVVPRSQVFSNVLMARTASTLVTMRRTDTGRATARGLLSDRPIDEGWRWNHGYDIDAMWSDLQFGHRLNRCCGRINRIKIPSAHVINA